MLTSLFNYNIEKYPEDVNIKRREKTFGPA